LSLPAAIAADTVTLMRDAFIMGVGFGGSHNFSNTRTFVGPPWNVKCLIAIRGLKYSGSF